MKHRSIRLLVADDCEPLRHMLVVLLRNDATIVGDVADGLAAVDAAERLHPDVVLMDYQMPRMDGVAASALIKRAPSPPAIVLFTADADPDLFERAYQAGVDVLLYKSSDLMRVAEALRWAARRRAA
jgi:DNA-binding NarL/FixJ family response regulator